MRSSKGSILTAIATGSMLILLLAAVPAWAAITGSAHDFSGAGYGSAEICVFCHSPHHAKQDAGTSVTPLWNHALTTATYTLYSSFSLKETPTQPNGPSRLCLSCHDGSVAIDSFGNMASGTNFMTGSSNVGTDLSSSHPISIRWRHFAAAGSTSHGGAASCANCHNGGHSAATLNGTVMFYGAVGSMTIECASCHEPHNKFPQNTRMLRENVNGSVLCLWCHKK